MACLSPLTNKFPALIHAEIFTQSNRGMWDITIKFPIALSGKNLLAGYTIDITDRKKAEKENNDLQAQLLYSEKLAALGTLSAGVGHEILNPLAIIKGFSNRLAKKLRIADPKEDVDKIWNAIARSVVRIENIINGLTIHARVDNDTIEAVDVNETINEVLSFILSLKHGDLIEIHQNLTAVNSIARGNKGKFHQVMFNIIKNAFDALEVRPSGRQIIIETLSAGENVIIHVSDNGSGIPRDAISRIFEPFFTTKVVGKGTGLGLSISKTIIEKFGGTITVSSDVGVGTKFTITLPRMNTQTEQIHPFIVDKLFNETN